jgi:hypothetical protein
MVIQNFKILNKTLKRHNKKTYIQVTAYIKLIKYIHNNMYWYEASYEYEAVA